VTRSLAPVGIADLSIHVPERFETAAELAKRSGIPEEVVVSKFGLAGKHVAAPDEHVSDMCIAAARPIRERADDLEIDAVVYFGSHWKDFAVWQVAPKIQHELGIEGFSLEVINVSAGAPVALKVVGDMLAADPHLRSVLMVAASRESHLVDYGNERARFTFPFGDGAVAALLRRNHPEHHLLASSILTDGSFWHHVRVPAGGSVHPATEETVRANMHTLDVLEPAELKRRLDPITVKHFVSVAIDAVERSRCSIEDVRLVLPIHMKRSIHEAILLELGVESERSIYLDHYGHMSAVDPLFSLCLARDEGLVAAGDLVVLLAAGTGFTWAASVIRWGPA
jgi:3-oxoacyl-[acyl-carrier-protein] synthase III